MTTQPARGFGTTRREHIMRELRTHGTVATGALADQLGVSAMTVRRDVNALAAKGLLVRVHGGAALPEPAAGVVDGPAPDATAPRGSRLTIGLVVPQLDYYFPRLVAGARAAAARAGARLVIRTTAYDPDEDHHQCRRLAGSPGAPGVDGLVVVPTMTGGRVAELLAWLDRLPTPVLLADRRPPEISPFKSLEWVASDHASGAATAVWHLHGQGHRRIGLLSLAGTTTSRALHHGWHDALRTLAIAPDEQVVGHTDGFVSPGRTALMAAVLDDVRRTGTTALLVHSDPFALSFTQYCHEVGVAVPDDLAVVAYDDEVADMGDPPLTAVRPPTSEVGRLAVENMVARLTEGARRPTHRVMLDPTLTVRGSSVRRR
ncbi:substrate-binding domain-containing protein [Isoptericola sp. BMS4]|uniref:substrate-binding domain-containing protein n=1 Tax=Isoptericola sp. BMS4 TaxID=2527875 RepID=UPI001423089D|nr:substrate-binding domain-containing protein [Isoptericola sp. BMS4]